MFLTPSTGAMYANFSPFLEIRGLDFCGLEKRISRGMVFVVESIFAKQPNMQSSSNPTKRLKFDLNWNISKTFQHDALNKY